MGSLASHYLHTRARRAERIREYLARYPPGHQFTTEDLIESGLFGAADSKSNLCATLPLLHRYQEIALLKPGRRGGRGTTPAIWKKR